MINIHLGQLKGCGQLNDWGQRNDSSMSDSSLSASLSRLTQCTAVANVSHYERTAVFIRARVHPCPKLHQRRKFGEILPSTFQHIVLTRPKSAFSSMLDRTVDPKTWRVHLCPKVVQRWNFGENTSNIFSRQRVNNNVLDRQTDRQTDRSSGVARKLCKGGPLSIEAP